MSGGVGVVGVEVWLIRRLAIILVCLSLTPARPAEVGLLRFLLACGMLVEKLLLVNDRARVDLVGDGVGFMLVPGLSLL